MAKQLFFRGSQMIRIIALFLLTLNLQAEITQSIYISVDRLKSPESVKKINYANYENLYLFHGNTLKNLNQKPQAMRYKPGKRGTALTPLLLKEARGKSKCIYSIGHLKELMPALMKKPAMLQHYLNYLVETVQHYGYDGIEIDWEHSIVLNQHLTLMKELRRKLNALSAKTRKKYILTTAMHAYLGNRFKKASADELGKQVDFINIMTYDLGGGQWGKSATHNTPLPAVQKIMEKWHKNFPAAKLHMGLANYGFSYKNLKPGEKNPEQVKKGGWMTCRQLNDLTKQGWKEKWDETNQVPYYFSPDGKSFATLENKRSLAKKISYARKQQFNVFFTRRLLDQA